MKSFKQYVGESDRFASLRAKRTAGHLPRSKGWFHLKKKKVIDIPIREGSYHVTEIVKKLKTFGVNKKAVLQRLEDKFERWDSPDPEEDAKKDYDEIRKGSMDIEYGIEELAMKKGWYRYYGGRYAEVSGVRMSKKTIRECLDFMETQGLVGVGGSGTVSFQVQEYKQNAGAYEPNTVKMMGASEVGDILKGRSIGTGRTEIGRTMAMFRDHVELDEGVKDIIKKLAKNKKIMAIVSKFRGQSTSKLAATLVTLPAVQAIIGSPDRMNQMRIIANGLKTMTEEDEN